MDCVVEKIVACDRWFARSRVRSYIATCSSLLIGLGQTSVVSIIMVGSCIWFVCVMQAGIISMECLHSRSIHLNNTTHTHAKSNSEDVYAMAILFVIFAPMPLFAWIGGTYHPQKPRTYQRIDGDTPRGPSAAESERTAPTFKSESDQVEAWVEVRVDESSGSRSESELPPEDGAACSHLIKLILILLLFATLLLLNLVIAVLFGENWRPENCTPVIENWTDRLWPTDVMMQRIAMCGIMLCTMMLPFTLRLIVRLSSSMHERRVRARSPVVPENADRERISTTEV